MSEVLNVTKTDRLFNFMRFRKLSPESLARGQAQKEYRADAKTSKAEHKVAVKRSEAEVEYRALRTDIIAAYDQLEAFQPVSDGSRDKLGQALDDTDDLAAEDDPDYPAMVKTLGAFKLEGMVKQASSDFDKGRKQAVKTFPNLFNLLKTFETEVEEARGSLTESERSGALADLRGATAAVVGDPTEAVAKQATKDLDTAFNGVEVLLKQAGQRLRVAERAKADAEQALDTARPVLSADQIALPEARFKAGQALMDGKDFVAAADAFNEAEAAATDAVGADTEAREDWDDLESTLPGLVKQAADQAKWFGEHAAGFLLAARESLAEAQSGLQALEAKPPQAKAESGAHSYPGAVLLVRQIEEQLDGVAEQIDGYKDFTADRNAARDRVRSAAEHAEVVIKLTRTVIAQADDLEGRQKDGYVPGTNKLLEELTERLANARETWRKRYREAADAASLRADEAVDCMRAIADEAVALGDDPEELGRALTTAAVTSAQDRLGGTLAAAEAQVDELALTDMDRALDLQGRLARYRQSGGAAKNRREVERVQDRAEEVGRKAVKSMQPAKGDIAAFKDEDWRAAERDKLAERIAALDTALEKRWAQIEKVSNTKERDALAALHGTYVTMLEGQRAMAKEDQTALLEECGDELTEMERLVEALGENFGLDKAKRVVLNALPKVRTDGTSIMELLGRAESLGKRLEKGRDLRTFAGDTVFELQERLDTLGKSLGTQTPARAAEELDAIEDGLGKAKTEAEAGRAEYDKLKERIAAAKKQLNGAELFKLVPKLTEQLKTELDAVRAAARKQGGPDKAVLDDLLALERRIAQPGAGPNGADVAVNDRGVPVSLEQQETDLIESERLFEVRKAVWDKKAELLRDEIKEIKESDRKDALLKRLSDAGKSYKTADDESVAETMLAAIRQQVHLVDLNPNGLKVHARNRLPQTKQRWKAAVASFRTATTGLVTTIGGVDDPDLTGPVKAAFGKTVSSVNSLFNAALFDPSVGKIIKEGVSDADAAAAREEALRELRRMRIVVDDDQRLVALARQTSFSPGLAGQLSELRLSLADLEQNLLVSL